MLCDDVPLKSGYWIDTLWCDSCGVLTSVRCPNELKMRIDISQIMLWPASWLSLLNCPVLSGGS